MELEVGMAFILWMYRLYSILVGVSMFSNSVAVPLENYRRE